MGVVFKPTNAAEFYGKYGLATRPDQLPFPAKPVELSEIANDFTGLAPADQYAVFVRLEQVGASEVLKTITGFASANEQFDSQTTSVIESRLKSLKKSLRLHRVGPPDALWQKRLEIEKARFDLGTWLTSYHQAFVQGGAAMHYVTVLEAHDAIRTGLLEIYQQAEVPRSLWDSDHDFDPEHPTESAFDDQDVIAYNPIGSADADQDLMPDNLDLNPTDPASYAAIAIGETRVLNKVASITHSAQDLFTINVDFKVAIDPNCADDELRAEYLNATFLETLADNIEVEFSKRVEKGSVKFVLNASFHPETNHPDIFFTTKRLREDSASWSLDSITDPTDVTALHETMHHLGFPDLYHEAIVDGGIRDRSLDPGFTVLTDGNTMANSHMPTNQIPLRDLMTLIGNATKPPAPAQNLTDTQFEHCATLVEQYSRGEKTPVLKFLAEQPPTLREAFSTVMFNTIAELSDASELFWATHDPAKIEDLASYGWQLRYRRRNFEAQDWFAKRVLPHLDLRIPTHRAALTFEAQALKETRAFKTAKSYYEQLLVADPTNKDLWISYAVCLHGTGDDEAARNALRKISDFTAKINLPEASNPRSVLAEYQLQIERFVGL